MSNQPERNSRCKADAMSLRRMGLAVIPLDGKKPLISGFNKWTSAPALDAVANWFDRYPDANVGIIPGLSRTPTTPYGLIITDSDDMAAVLEVRRIFGETPIGVGTRRGQHGWHRSGPYDLGPVGALRKYGLNVDIKHGQRGSGICVVPPSRHPDQPDFVYSWMNGPPVDLAGLPEFNVDALRRLIGSQVYRATPNASAAASAELATMQNKTNLLGFRHGSRRLGLNDYLFGRVAALGDYESCLRMARAWNAALRAKGVELLEDPEVQEVCRDLMGQIAAGKLDLRRHASPHVRIEHDEVQRLLMQPKGEDALALLHMLRMKHAARTGRGEVFAISPRAMEQANVIGQWSAARYRKATAALIEARLVVRVSAARKGVAARYRLDRDN